MFDDIFKGTDFGNIKGKADVSKESGLEKEAKAKDIWHTGQKPDVWAVDPKDVWSTKDDSKGNHSSRSRSPSNPESDEEELCFDDREDCGGKCDGCGEDPKPIHHSTGAFNDIF